MALTEKFDYDLMNTRFRNRTLANEPRGKCVTPKLKSPLKLVSSAPIDNDATNPGPKPNFLQPMLSRYSSSLEQVPDRVLFSLFRRSEVYRVFVLFSACAFGCLFLLGCFGCSSTPPTPFPGALTGQNVVALSNGDVVKVSFTGAPELNQSQKVGTDGKISLPLVGQVTAAGKSLLQLQQELSGLYKTQLQNSEVIVTLETRALPVVVSGAVQKPGKITFERPATILEAIMEAGGFTPEANLKKVSLIRIVRGQHYSKIFDLRSVLQGQPTPAVYVSSGDVIYVPEKLLNF
jgi:polysaccharide biosynthesis/export protein